MRTKILAVTAGILALGAVAPAFAQTTEQTTTVVTKRDNTGTGVGAVGGAAAGAVVGGPVGAVVGGVAGAVAGHTVDPPAEVKTYVRTQHVEAVPYNGQIVVGAVLPDTVREYDVPRYERYRWTYINGQRLLIDRQTHKIVSIINDEG
jgi:uncharacterized protein DUF1236